MFSILFKPNWQNLGYSQLLCEHRDKEAETKRKRKRKNQTKTKTKDRDRDKGVDRVGMGDRKTERENSKKGWGHVQAFSQRFVGT